MSSVDFDIQFPDLGAKLKRAEKEIQIFIAAMMQTNRGMLFDQEGAYNGHKKWAPLVFRQGQILSQRGTLRQSLAPRGSNGQPGPGGIVEFGNGVVTIGTNLFYAPMMNWGTTLLSGGVLRPVRAKALKIPLPQGKQASSATQLINRAANERRIRELQGKADRAKKDSTRAKYVQQIEKLRSKSDFTRGKEKFIFRKSVKIPERRFDDWTAEDELEMSESLMNKVVEVLSRD